jgi:hypothetical protein
MAEFQQVPTVLDGGEPDPAETAEWLASLRYVLDAEGPERARAIVSRLNEVLAREGLATHGPLNTPYVNTIPTEKQSAQTPPCCDLSFQPTGFGRGLQLLQAFFEPRRELLMHRQLLLAAIGAASKDERFLAVGVGTSFTAPESGPTSKRRENYLWNVNG